ncbi:MAG: dTDP-4-dehydrorhamnose 3,5-epimerase [Proteobacteria bacterium]|nr:dTDP-4-dehydrorhamnose 3,5-epimerase [Pseudomonadota bacterium]MBU4294859.1 dTDP-4-dehydrorhamnose 3,5-epimerase [Pseudomonadota bacterium]MCG2749361.1 dTDP-4-dehydrorhamnose 3,5-epimerase [Desulfobulbaceae bacterium]
MNVIETQLSGVLILEPRVFDDNRGFFMETFHKEKYEQIGIKVEFVQDNFSFSQKNTLRGLHFQHPHGQAKLVQVFQGAVFDVAVDIRLGSPTFGKWVGVELSAANKRQIFIPAGFAHGFVVLSDTASFVYKCSDFYSPDCERGIIFSDPQLAIRWPGGNFLLSPKDQQYPALQDISPGDLPSYTG